MLLKHFTGGVLLVVSLFSISFSQDHVWNNKQPQKDITFLISYLQTKQPTEEQTQQALKIIRQSQSFLLHYDSDSLNKDTVWRKQVHEEWIDVILIAGPSIELLIRPRSAGGPSAPFILECIRQPISAGYQPKSGYIVYISNSEIHKTTFLKCQAIMTKIADDLQQIKPKYKQLQNFDKNALSLGYWNDQQESKSRFPRIHFLYGAERFALKTKPKTEPTTEFWCEIIFYFEYSNGQMSPFNPGRTYPRQGITASFIVRAAKEHNDFTTEVYKIINTELKPLEEYEKELDQKL
jgi:hypothetical protein